MEESRKLSGKDLITIGIFSAIYFVLNLAAMITGFVPVLWLLLPGVTGIVTGIPFLLMASKVRKPGAVLIMGTITALLYFVTGQFTVLLLITFAIACILSELYRAVTKYDNSFTHMMISFVFFCYALFPGIDLIFMDFNCSDTFHEPIPNKNIIEIRHYQKGRVEFELRNNKVFHMKEGEFCINALANIPAAYSFPFGYSVGLSCVIDKDSVDVETQQIFSYYNIDVLNLGRELELEKKWFLCRTPQRLLHIFEELYAAKGVEERDYFRIKLLELFYHIKQLRIEDQYEATYYAKEQIEIIKRIRQQLIENLDKKISIEELLRKEPMSKVTFQAIFKQIYGDTPYAHIKKYKMNLAAVYLQKTDQSITQIAGELGYSNISKFARAFQEVFGMLPKDYRKAKKVI